MDVQFSNGKTRREFLKQTGQIAAATTIVSATAPFVHAGEDNTIRLALVGCGGRGTGAAANALSVKNGPIQLVALADIIPGQLANAVGAWAGMASSSMFRRTADSSALMPIRRRWIVCGRGTW